MLQKKCTFYLLLLLSLFSAYSSVSALDFWTNTNKDELQSRLIESMTDEQLLGQMMLLGYMGGTPSSDILDWIENREIGGVKIFGWNVADLETLAGSIREMQQTARKTELQIPLFIVTDQEGGWVRHVRAETSETPGNMALGASRIPDDAFKTGYYIGMELRELGINMNFAPTVDVYSNAEAHVIGPRAFSQDALLTAVLSTAYFKGMDSAGVICTAKHYPGHGDADKDSHGALPIIDINFDTMWERDLLPYRYLVRENIPAIMSGHLAFPEITGSEIPASLSPFFLNDILRDRLNFKGLVVTDDLMMNGVQLLSMNTPEICKTAIEAGNDIILVSRTPEIHQKVWEYLLKEIKNNKDFRETVRASAKRIISAKLAYLKDEGSIPLFPDPDHILDNIPNHEGKDFFIDQAYRAVTEIYEGSTVDGKNRKILLAGQLDRFFAAGKKAYPDADTFSFDYSPFYTSEASVRNSLKKKADNYDTVIFCLANPNGFQVLKELEDSKAEIAVFSVLTPVYLRELPWVDKAIAVYGISRESIDAGFAALTGTIKPEGNLPLSLETHGEN